MRLGILSLVAIALITMAGCKKKTEVAEVAAPATQSAPQAPAAAAPAEVVDPALAEKKAALDYATMEDTYMNDPKAQWASAATATSTFGDDDGKTPADSNLAINMTGKLSDKSWSNNNQDKGFDRIELTYEKPVMATEVRLVCGNDHAVESISKVELQAEDGTWNTVWSGVSDVKNDTRGRRTWFVKTFDKTTYPVKAVRYSLANNVSSGYKVIYAAQLVGE